MSAGIPESLIDRIYEAAVIPHLWLDVLEDLSALTSAVGAFIFTRSGGGDRWLATDYASEMHSRSLSSGWQASNDRMVRLFQANHQGFLSDLDIYSAKELDEHPYYTNFLRPNGLGWGAASAIAVPNGDAIGITVERLHTRGPVERECIARLDGLRPHLARAGLISARLALEQARSAVLALDALGLPAGVIGNNRRLIAANERLGALMPATFQDRRERVWLSDPSADALLGRALDSIKRDGEGDVRSIPIAAIVERPPLIAHVVPVRRSAQDLFARASALLVVSPVVPSQVPDASLLQGLFDLTPSEARVARGIGEGKTVEAIAEMHGYSMETVRSQLKVIFAKTGTARQANLALLLTGAHTPPGVR